MLQIYLQWNAEDPVSEFEDQRNPYLETAYGNSLSKSGVGNDLGTKYNSTASSALRDLRSSRPNH